MEDIVRMQNIVSAFIGLGSAIIVAILTGIFQLIIARKDREITKKQFEQSQREYSEKVKQLYEEQKNANIAKANDKLQAETNRFYNDLLTEMHFYDCLLNELHYLNNITHPNNKELRVNGAYPYIDVNVNDIVGSIALRQNIAKLLGALRANISLYNAALEAGTDSAILEDNLNKIHNLIDPINTERFENYAIVQSSLRQIEIRMAERIIDK